MASDIRYRPAEAFLSGSALNNVVTNGFHVKNERYLLLLIEI